MDEKENRLVEMVLAGNPGAFESLVRPYRQSLLSLAYRLTGDAEDAKEAAQEALLRAFRYLRSFDREQSFRNWLLRILVNASRKNFARRGETRSLEDAAEAVEPSAGPAARYQSRELRSRLEECLGVLSERERAVFVLRDIEEKNIKETAEVIGSSAVSVRVHLSAARRKIRDEMLKRYPGMIGGRR